MRTTRLGWLGVMLCFLSATMWARPSDVSRDPKGTDFGTTNLTHVRVSPFEFQPQSAAEGGKAPGPGWTFYGTGIPGIWGAGVHLPGGSLLKRIELDYCDTNTDDFHLELGLEECDNQWENCTGVAETLISTSNGCAFVSSSAVSQRIDNYHHTYALAITFGSNDGTNTLGGVILSYQLDVSPAPGSPTFNDVPPSDPAYQYIEALVASGITAGCSGGNYCPDAPLTRRQMAVFLAKALGLQWTGY